MAEGDSISNTIKECRNSGLNLQESLCEIIRNNSNDFAGKLSELMMENEKSLSPITSPIKKSSNVNSPVKANPLCTPQILGKRRISFSSSESNKVSEKAPLKKKRPLLQ